MNTRYILFPSQQDEEVNDFLLLKFFFSFPKEVNEIVISYMLTDELKKMYINDDDCFIKTVNNSTYVCRLSRVYLEKEVKKLDRLNQLTNSNNSSSNHYNASRNRNVVFISSLHGLTLVPFAAFCFVTHIFYPIALIPPGVSLSCSFFKKQCFPESRELRDFKENCQKELEKRKSVPPKPQLMF